VSGGDVILFEGDDYIGSPVNLAARLCDVAAPGEVLATADMAEFVPEQGDVRPVEPRLVPGFMQPVTIVAVGVAEPITGTHEIIAS
jgi:class 3 adenylate cyclase